jgi:hypothetical protein
MTSWQDFAPVAIAAAAIALWRYRYGLVHTPDGGSYLLAAGGHPSPNPFRWRLLPRALGPLARGVLPDPRHWGEPFRQAPRAVAVWDVASLWALAVSAVVVGELAETHGVPAWLATLLFVTLPWFRSLVRNPCLTDQIGMAEALLCAVAIAGGHWWLAALAALFAGSANERAPLFAALVAWSPLPLIGLVVPAIGWLVTRRKEMPWTIGGNDWRRWREEHAKAPLLDFVLPWGAGLAALGWLFLPGPAPVLAVPAALAVVLGYSQLAIASDRVRLYQWAAPLVVIVAAQALIRAPWWVVTLVVVAHIVSPWGERQR